MFCGPLKRAKPDITVSLSRSMREFSLEASVAEAEPAM
jgi:hypothetical protein